MSTPNLDGRYAKPADVTAAVAAQAVTDAGQYAQQWKANTTYAANQIVIAPDGSTISSVTGFTSGATYNSSNWTILSPTANSISSTYATQSGVTSAIAARASLTPAGSIMISGSWSAPTLYGSISSNAMSVNTEYYVPFIPAKSGTISQMGIDIQSTASGGTARFGVYNSDSNFQPKTLLSEGATQASASTTGWKKVTLSSHVSVTGGNAYWLAVACQGASFNCRSILGISPLVASGDNSATNLSGYTSGGVTGTLYADTGGSFGNLADFAPFIRALVV